MSMGYEETIVRRSTSLEKQVLSGNEWQKVAEFFTFWLWIFKDFELVVGDTLPPLSVCSI